MQTGPAAAARAAVPAAGLPRLLPGLESLAGAVGLLVALITVLWSAWWSGGNAFILIFAVEIALPLAVAGLAALVEGRRRSNIARYTLWVAFVVAVLEVQGMLWMLPFAISFALVVVAFITSLARVDRIRGLLGARD